MSVTGQALAGPPAPLQGNPPSVGGVPCFRRFAVWVSSKDLGWLAQDVVKDHTQKPSGYSPPATPPCLNQDCEGGRPPA